jgi:hypothetical protein
LPKQDKLDLIPLSLNRQSSDIESMLEEALKERSSNIVDKEASTSSRLTNKNSKPCDMGSKSSDKNCLKFNRQESQNLNLQKCIDKENIPTNTIKGMSL